MDSRFGLHRGQRHRWIILVAGWHTLGEQILGEKFEVAR